MQFLHYPHLRGERLESRMRDILSSRPEFQSILGTLLLSIAVKLAVALIEYWIEQKFSTPPAGGFVKGEPGFSLAA